MNSGKMKILDIHNHTIKPGLYEKGNAIMWTDPYISEQLLDVHLNSEIDLASRKTSTIESTVNWILSNVKNENLDILDLGCGPGLYAEKFAEKGHHVTGVDFSENSINYAQVEAKKKNMDIKYIKGNYLELNLQEYQFDLVLLIFADFGPLLPDERGRLLNMIRKVLKPGGIFIFDVLNDNNIEGKISPKNWEASKQGFWKNAPYLALSESFLYKEEKVILYQHIVIDEEGNMDTYRFWNHFFSKSDLEEILLAAGFGEISFYINVIPSGDMCKSEDVTFCKVINIK
jgi:2-polyprenyl-3-methyl-5-hydroxy-6-metoxy-1,4-benzoquinol methylase